jgi:hypothetical protein
VAASGHGMPLSLPLALVWRDGFRLWEPGQPICETVGATLRPSGWSGATGVRAEATSVRVGR